MDNVDQLFKSLLLGDEIESVHANFLLSQLSDAIGEIRVNENTIKLIKTVIHDDSSHICMNIARHLGHLNNKGEDFIEEMSAHLRRLSSDDKSTLFVLFTLADLCEKAVTAVDAVSLCLAHSNPEIRFHAIFTLSDIGGSNESVFKTIADAIRSEQIPFVVFAGIRVLMESRFKENYLQLCRLLDDAFHDKMNVSEQDVIANLFNETR